MRSFLRSFLFAFRGVRLSFRRQRNIKVQLAAGIAVISWSMVIRLPALEFALVLFLCFFVIILEMLNTAFERLIDRLSPRYNKSYGEIKDILAGTVLLAAVLTVTAGMVVLLKPSLEFIRKLFAL